MVRCEILATDKMIPTKAKLDIRDDRQLDDEIAQQASTVEKEGVVQPIIVTPSNANMKSVQATGDPQWFLQKRCRRLQQGQHLGSSQGDGQYKAASWF